MPKPISMLNSGPAKHAVIAMLLSPRRAMATSVTRSPIELPHASTVSPSTLGSMPHATPKNSSSATNSLAIRSIQNTATTKPYTATSAAPRWGGGVLCAAYVLCQHSQQTNGEAGAKSPLGCRVWVVSRAQPSDCTARHAHERRPNHPGPRKLRVEARCGKEQTRCTMTPTLHHAQGSHTPHLLKVGHHKQGRKQQRH